MVPRVDRTGWNAQLNSPPATARTSANSSNSTTKRGIWERELGLRRIQHPPFGKIISAQPMQTHS